MRSLRKEVVLEKIMEVHLTLKVTSNSNKDNRKYILIIIRFNTLKRQGGDLEEAPATEKKFK